MPRQVSVIKISGTLDGLTFYKKGNDFFVKKKGGPTEAQIHEPDYQNALRNAEEWKRAIKAGQLIRNAMGPLLNGVKSGFLNGRMNKLFLKAVQADPESEWGYRTITKGDPATLNGFEFNAALALDDALPLNINNHLMVDRDKIDLLLPAFRLRSKKGLPEDATHYRLVSAVVTPDFHKQRYVRDFQYSAVHAMGRKAGAAFHITHHLPFTGQGCYWLVGIDFYKMINEKPVLLQGSALTVMQWIGIAHGTAAANIKQDIIVPEIASTKEAAQPLKNEPIAFNYITHTQSGNHVCYQTVQPGWFSTILPSPFE